MAEVTMPVLDLPSERATQIRQAARQALMECQDDKAMRRALVARPRPWREFQVGDQFAIWRKGKGRGMKHGHARWHGRAVTLALCSLVPRMCGWQYRTSVTQGVTGTVAHGHSHRKGCG